LARRNDSEIGRTQDGALFSKKINKCRNKIRGVPVVARARAISVGYKDAARKADILYNNMDKDDTTPGPIQAHLETLGKVVELVMGHFSEGSPDMHERWRRKQRGRNIGSG